MIWLGIGILAASVVLLGWLVVEMTTREQDEMESGTNRDTPFWQEWDADSTDTFS